MVNKIGILKIDSFNNFEKLNHKWLSMGKYLAIEALLPPLPPPPLKQSI
jgi:hypothetical protein